MKTAGGFHLTYCSNIHPGESWPEVSAALAAALPKVRAQLGFEGPFAVGLRLSAVAALALEEPAALETFRDFLTRGNYYVPTINGFPYGAFHGTRVKERVYLPDWRSPDRLEYTNRLARLLATLLADRLDVVGSVSTVPGAFRADIRSHSDVVALAAGMLRHAAYLKTLREKTGILVALALEPEPACFLETVDDAVSFFESHLFTNEAIVGVSHETGVALTVEDVRTHVGVCLDVCHMAVEFEDPSAAIDRLARAGIHVRKVQLSSALRIQEAAGAPAPATVLARFADDTYLHQVVVRRSGGLVRYTDLPEALAAHPSSVPEEWRVHCHVPVFLPRMAKTGTTQEYLQAVLQLLRLRRFCPMLEVETYTWDVLPAEYRTVDMHTAIARELAWVTTALQR
ncbi:MAG: hypothetical protein A3H97_03315 [Acidobacteria bacterium RIFCSPLOWO2_02_FULL_65_29]|nr:MAG: hypothetical protein A3H97_03315 [Acidobacteria bacterium RIFCSPLOWO2_02_FULL_65_29]